MRHSKIRELMTSNVVVAAKHHKFSQVLEFFAKFPVHHIPVIENDDVIGIVSAKDVIKNFYTYLSNNDFCVELPKLDAEVSIEDIMTKNPKVIGPDDSLELAASYFVNHKFHALPVVEDGKVCGIITTKDIAREVLDRQ